MSQVLLALPFGVVIGLSLGLVGAGGSIVALPVLVYVLGEPVKAATTESLLIVGTTSLIGSIPHAHAGRVRWRTAAAFGGAGDLGAIAGTALNRAVDPRSILLAFAIVLVLAAAAMARGRGEPHRAEVHPQGRSLWMRLIPCGLCTGILTGFFGVGGGFAIVPALTLVLGIPLASAIGTALLIIAITSAGALTAHLGTGHINWAVAIAFTASAVAGALSGALLGRRTTSHRLAQIFATLLVCIAVFLIGKNVATLA